MRVLAELFDTFHQRYPLVQFDLLTATADIVREQMDKGLLDLGLLLEPVDMEKYDFVRLNVRERWVALMPANAPMASKEAVTAQDLAGQPLIIPRRAQVQSELSSWFGDHDMNVLFTSNLTTNGALMVERGLAYSLVIEGSMPFEDASRIVGRPLLPELTATSVLAWKRGQPFALPATRFIEHAKCFLGMDDA